MKSKCCEMWQKMSSLDLSKLGHCTHRRGLGWLSTSVAVDIRRCQQFWFCSAKQKWRTPPSLPLCRAPQFSRCCHLQLHGRCHHSQCHLPTHHHQTSTWTALWTLSKAELLEDAWHFGFQFKSCHLSDSRMFLRISYEMILYIYMCIVHVMHEKEALAALEQVLEAQDLCNLLKQEEGLQTENNTWKLGSSVDLLKYVEYSPICRVLICPAEFLSFAFSFSASNNGCNSSERRSEMLPSWLATARACATCHCKHWSMIMRWWCWCSWWQWLTYDYSYYYHYHSLSSLFLLLVAWLCWRGR